MAFIRFQSRKKHLKGEVTPDKAAAQAVILANSVKNKFRHLSKKYRRENIDCFRLYDWDSPDIRVVIDWYAGHLVVAEYERLQTGPEYLPQMAQAAACALGVPAENIHLKRRHTKIDGARYEKLADRNERLIVNERGLKFWVNLDDFLDTGLFNDHRDTRAIIAKEAGGKDFLNLFAYTGAFTCAAALGGAKSTTTVDRSETYLFWAKDNLILNDLWCAKHVLVQSDTMVFLDNAFRQHKKYDLIFLDPPSFFQDSARGVEFDVNRDHPYLLEKALKLLAPGGELFFSTNHQRFEPKFTTLGVKDIISLTSKTIPEDYRNKAVHSCWRFKV